MQKKSLIKQNILQYLEIKGITKYKFYQESGITRGILDQDNGISEENTAKILAYFPELNAEWLITGNSPMLKNLENVESMMVHEPPSTYNKKEVPMYDLVAGTEMIVNEPQANEYVNPGDLFADATAIMRIYGNSMEPKYPSGSFVPIKPLKSKTMLIYGQDYVIQTNEYRVLKRIQKANIDNHILACSINTETYEVGELKGKQIHEPFSVSLDEIVSISVVLGCVTRNQISNIY